MKDSKGTQALQKHFYKKEEAAAMLGIAARTLDELRDMHPLYKPDGTRSLQENRKKESPLWSRELLELIAFARSISSQGVRQLTDDEGLKVRQGMEDSRRRQYLSYIDS